MRFFSRYTFRFSLCLVLVTLMFVLICTCLIPPVLKNALLESKRSFMLQSSEFIIDPLENGHFSSVMNAVPRDSAMRVIIADSRLAVIHDSATQGNIKGKYLVLPGVDKAFSGEEFYNAYSEENDFIYSMLRSFTFDGNDYLLFMRYTDGDSARLFKTCKQVCIFSGILLLIVPVALLIAQIVSFNKSITNLSNSITHLTTGKYVPGQADTASDEIADISRHLDEFAARQAKTEELRRTFVSDASHELKTPLAAVKLLSDTILLTPQMSHEDVREFLTDISNEIDRLTRICTRLLQITKFDAFSDKADLVPLDLATVAENVSRMLSKSATAAGLDLRCEIQDGCYVSANYDLVFQVFYNLIENAIKYGADGNEVRIFLYQKDCSVIFIVDDDGAGIPENDLKRIFDRFYRVDKARSRATGGTGLGLSIVATAVATCRGTVEAQNRSPHGARFIVRFPSCPKPTANEDGEPS